MPNKTERLEVRLLAADKWIIGCKHNSSIIYIADSEQDARETLKAWQNANEYLEALKTINKIAKSSNRPHLIAIEQLTNHLI